MYVSNCIYTYSSSRRASLSSTLKEMESDGLIHRKEYPQIPPKVEYSLTEKGQTLWPLIQEMCQWGEHNKEK